MGYSGIGGQAVMEGVMMKNRERYAVAVRKPDGEIITDVGEYKGILYGNRIKKVPFIRGALNFVDSLALGMKTLMYSASFYEDEEKGQDTDGNTDKEKQAASGSGKTKEKRKEDAICGPFWTIPTAGILQIKPALSS